MHLSILAIGRAKKGALSQLTDEWFNRLPRKGQIIECESRLPSGNARQKEESGKLLAAYQQRAPQSARLIAFDPHGRNISSPELAHLIDSYRNDGVGACFFAIGGAEGHHESLLAKADKKLSFGSATWPHMLFRAMVAEQLYRAEMILANHPYHKE